MAGKEEWLYRFYRHPTKPNKCTSSLERLDLATVDIIHVVAINEKQAYFLANEWFNDTVEDADGGCFEYIGVVEARYGGSWHDEDGLITESKYSVDVFYEDHGWNRTRLEEVK